MGLRTRTIVGGRGQGPEGATASKGTAAYTYINLYSSLVYYTGWPSALVPLSASDCQWGPGRLSARTASAQSALPHC